MLSHLDAKKVNFSCPNDDDADYEHEKQCDKFYRCINGRATEHLCPDGLVFDQNYTLPNKCVPVFDVDCGDRLELREC